MKNPSKFQPGMLILNGEQVKDTLPQRNQVASRWSVFFFAACVMAIGALIILLLTIINQAFGLVEYRVTVDPSTLSSQPLDDLDNAALGTIIGENIARNRLRAIFRNELVGASIPPEQLTTLPVTQLLEGKTFPPELAEKTLANLTEAELAVMLSLNLPQAKLLSIIDQDIVKFQVVKSWQLLDSLFNRTNIEREVAADPTARLQFYAWLNPDFIGRAQTSTPTTTGLRTALFGSLWIILVTVGTALPLGIGAAIYLEEYATPTRINRLIETNIRNLAGVPSIIYGMLGLAVFVRTLGSFTSGSVFGVTDSNGRTVLSAGLTMALLILPVIIINAQEAIRAVPRSIREASYGVGATRWQTTARQVLPAAFPGILTGLILSMSRAIGETAPLLVVGASTAISIDPNGPFSKFTVVPIQIFEWTAQPEQAYRNVAAAAIVVLLALLLTMNATAIILRQRISRRLAG